MGCRCWNNQIGDLSYKPTHLRHELLTLGADLYTVSKLLGHSQIKNTQIYAEIINRRKDEAVNLIDKVFD